MDYSASYEALANEAALASKNARVPNSHYQVGAAILMLNGMVWRGCNVETGSTINTIHAEINAIGNMITYGSLPKNGVAMAVYTNEDIPWRPCGFCRQSIYELFSKSFKIIMCNDNGIYEVITQEEMLPKGYCRRKK